MSGKVVATRLAVPSGVVIAGMPARAMKQPAKKFREFVEQLTKSASYTVKPASKTGQVMALFPDAARLAQELLVDDLDIRGCNFDMNKHNMCDYLEICGWMVGDEKEWRAWKSGL